MTPIKLATLKLVAELERGLTAELHYPDGRIFIVEGKERT